MALARAIGRKRALEMLLTGDPIDAATAAAWGLVNRVVPDARVADETRALLAAATRGSALSKSLGKQAFHRQVDLDIPRRRVRQRGDGGSLADQDAREGMAAFRAKRSRSSAIAQPPDPMNRA